MGQHNAQMAKKAYGIRHVTCVEYRDGVWSCGEGIRKTKELNLERDVKSHKKGFYK